MIWLTHLVGGLLFYNLAVMFHLIPYSTELVYMAILGSLVPDLDHPQAYISHLSIFSRTLSSFFQIFGHRTLLHSILGIILWYGILMYLLPVIGIHLTSLQVYAFMIGYFSHLILDSLTVSGIYWFWPLRLFKTRFIFRTGSIGDILLMLVMVIFMVRFWP